MSKRHSQPVAPLLSCCMVLLILASRGYGQVSLRSSVSLALSSSPRVRLAEADASRALASLQNSRDTYIPSINGSSAAGGFSYGFPLGTPTVFSITAQSLIFSFSQQDYVRAAREGLISSRLTLLATRETVVEDTVVTYLAISNDQLQHEAILQELDYAIRLRKIVEDRLTAGFDTEMDSLRALRNVAQLHLQLLQNEEAMENHRDHLSRLMGVSGQTLIADPSSIPDLPIESPSFEQGALPTLADKAFENSADVAASFANAKAKREQAFGDSRYVLRPQVTFEAQLSRFSTYNSTYVNYYPSVVGQGLSQNAVGFSLNVTIPLLDASHRAKARISAADAVHSEQQARIDQSAYREGLFDLSHSLTVLRARAALTLIDLQLAQKDLEIVLVRLNSAASSPSSSILTPKDEQTARTLERQRYVDHLEAQFLMRKADIHLLKQTEQLDQWLGLDPVPAR